MTASHLVPPRDRGDRERRVRLGCGHMGEITGSCAECADLGEPIDPWLIAGGPDDNEGDEP